MRRIPPLLVLSFAFLFGPAVAGEDDPPPPEIGEEIPVAWRLAPSDFVHYERKKVDRKGDREILGRAEVVGIHGHAVDEEGRFVPANQMRKDLPAVLAFLLPPDGKSSGKVVLDLAPVGITSVRVKGEVVAREYGPDAAFVTGEHEFESRGRAAKSDTHQIRKGTATVRAVFDRTEGVVKSARIRIAYVYRAIDARPTDKTVRVEIEYDFQLVDLKRARYTEFQEDVDGAIERGVARLRSLAKKDGTFEPHGNWDFGTTALAIFTLVSCDVPRSDPRIEKALTWMCAQTPARTYAQSVGLMALDRAYTPPWEMARERRGEPVTYKRDLSADRRAWCERTALALEKGARSPGTWSYPQTNPSVILQFDASNTQYAVLGFRAAVRMGIPVKEMTWLGVVRFFEQMREGKGPRGAVALLGEGESADATVAPVPVPKAVGFRYSTTSAYPTAWGSMTCAGIASLAIARDQLTRMKSRRLDSRMQREIAGMILGAWGWLETNWTMDRHPKKPRNSWYYYYLYSLERAAVLTRVKKVGGKDWYFEGAMQLLARQHKDGSWKQPGGGDIPETCFALLFLKRATAPLTGK